MTNEAREALEKVKKLRESAAFVDMDLEGHAHDMLAGAIEESAPALAVLEAELGRVEALDEIVHAAWMSLGAEAEMMQNKTNENIHKWHDSRRKLYGKVQALKEKS